MSLTDKRAWSEVDGAGWDAPIASAPVGRGMPAAGPAAHGRPSPTLAPAMQIVLVGVLAALGGLSFRSAIGASDLLVPVVAGAAVGAGATAVTTGLLHRRLAVSAVVWTVVLVPAAMVACSAAPGDVVSGVVDGPRLILTSAVPARPDAAVLVVPFLVTALVAFVGGELAWRSRSALAPAVPPLVALVVGLAFGDDGTRPPGWVVTGWIVAAAMLVGARRATAGRGASGGQVDDPASASPGTLAARSILVVVPIAVVVAVVADGVAPRLPGAEHRGRFELRDLIGQPALPTAEDDPLAKVVALQEGPDELMFTAETTAPVPRWRLAVLDTYDGTSWDVGATFTPAAHELPRPPDGVEGARVTQDVQLGALEGRWLPVADRAVRVSADDVAFDTTGGVLVAVGQAPDEYEVDSVVPAPAAADLAAASVARDDEAAAALALPPGVPTEIEDAAEAITQGLGSAYMEATAIERYLAESPTDRFQLAAENAPTGHSFENLRCLLFDEAVCGRRGSTEQFVAAFALLAREAGLPTRVVVGFAGSGSAGVDDVTAHDARAWPEVKFEGVGWVAFDPVPNPQVTSIPPATAVPGGGGAADSQTSTTALPSDTGAEGEGPGDGEDDGAKDASALPWLVVLAGIALAVVAAPAAIRRTRRRRRRRAATPAAQVAGAWAEAVDELGAAGVTVPDRMAVREVVATGRGLLVMVAEPLVPLGELVNRARFSPGGAGESDAEAAWRCADHFATARRRHRSGGQRVREHFRVRTVGGRRRPSARADRAL